MVGDGNDAQTKLATMWHSGQEGYLSPWSEAKVWALREVYQETHGGKTYGMNVYIAGKVEKIGDGNPTKEAIRQLLQKMDEDPDGFQASVQAQAVDLEACPHKTKQSLHEALWR